MRVNMYVTMVLGVALALLVTGLTAAGRAADGSVTGTVTATGMPSAANIVVSLTAPGLTAKAPAEPVEMDQKGMKFIPHVLPVVRGTTVRFLNSDAVPHNVFSPEGKYNLGTWPRGQSKDYTFGKAGVYTQLCRVHLEMEGFVVALDTPYFTTTDEAGQFEIPNVPPGKYTLTAWSEKLKKGTQAVTVEADKSVVVDLTLKR